MIAATDSSRSNHNHQCNDSITTDSVKKQKGVSRWIAADIIVEILTRLPAASLARLRCVCKQWHELVCNHVVVLQHAVLSTRTSPDRFADISYQLCGRIKAAQGFFVANMTGYLNILNERLEPLYDLEVIPLHECTSNHAFSWDPRMSNSCHGLVCIYNKKMILLMNPTTRESVELPEPEKLGVVDRWFNLGFDPTTKEYKVLCISEKKPKVCLQVMTLGKSSTSLKWRPISHTDCLPINLRAEAVDGRIYWLALKEQEMMMMSFDLRSESFELISLPTAATGVSLTVEARLRSVLMVVDGHLCWAFPDRTETMVVTWVLKDAAKHTWVCKFCEVKPSATGLFLSFQNTLVSPRSLVATTTSSSH